MKSDSYHIWIMLGENDLGYAHVLRATCECAVGYVLKLMHAYTQCIVNTKLHLLKHLLTYLFFQVVS